MRDSKPAAKLSIDGHYQISGTDSNFFLPQPIPMNISLDTIASIFRQCLNVFTILKGLNMNNPAW
ncbi:MAG TPA: hypothetical protein VJ111_02915 [Chitinophagaceae bacterium]|nr:hypothetical protein [Chitinophagaceae bacterium]